MSFHGHNAPFQNKNFCRNTVWPPCFELWQDRGAPLHTTQPLRKVRLRFTNSTKYFTLVSSAKNRKTFTTNEMRSDFARSSGDCSDPTEPAAETQNLQGLKAGPFSPARRFSRYQLGFLRLEFHCRTPSPRPFPGEFSRWRETRPGPGEGPASGLQRGRPTAG